MAANLPPNPTAMDLEDEIVFLEARISSLDPESSDFASDEKELTAELHVLQEMLAELHSDSGSRPNSRGEEDIAQTGLATAMRAVTPPRTASQRAAETHGSPLPDRTSLQRANFAGQRAPAQQDMPSAQSSRDFSGASRTSSKRPLETSASEDEGATRASQRTRANTPDTVDGESNDLKALFSSSQKNAERMKRVREQQERLMAAAEARVKQKRRDEELARQLARQGQSAHSQGSAASQSQPQGQAIFRPDGSYSGSQRPVQPTPSVNNQGSFGVLKPTTMPQFGYPSQPQLAGPSHAFPYNSNHHRYDFTGQAGPSQPHHDGLGRHAMSVQESIARSEAERLAKRHHERTKHNGAILQAHLDATEQPAPHAGQNGQVPVKQEGYRPPAQPVAYDARGYPASSRHLPLPQIQQVNGQYGMSPFGYPINNGLPQVTTEQRLQQQQYPVTPQVKREGQAQTHIKAEASRNPPAVTFTTYRDQPAQDDDSDIEEISRDVYQSSSAKRKSPHKKMPLVKTNGTSYHHDLYSAYAPERFQERSPLKGSFSAQLMQGARAVVDQGRALLDRWQDTLYAAGSAAGPSKPRDRNLYFDDNDDDLYGMDAQYSYGREVTEQERAEQAMALVDNIRPDDDVPPEAREQTPEAFRYALYEHQKIALAWLKRMEEGSNKGGILADDMGLGKTLEALALMVARPSDNPRRKTNLILAPVALLRQWETEIKTKLKPGRHQLTVFIHHGPKKKKTFQDLRVYDVVVTTFGTLAAEMGKLQTWRHNRKTNPQLPQPRGLVLVGDGCSWYRIIIDEAQCIRNKTTKTSGATCELDSIYRWCMTGTPMMNSLKDIYGLIRFLRIRPYNDWHAFRNGFAIDEKWSEAVRHDGMMKFQAMLKAILLRRTKQSQIDGRPIIQLPERHVEKDHVVFEKDQDEMYRALEAQSQLTINKFLEAGTIMKHYQNVLVLLLRLRQACCHPHLIKDIGDPLNVEDIPLEQRVDYASQLSPDTVRRIIEGTSDGALECPICMDATANPTILFPCGHGFCSEDFAKVTSQEAGIQQGDENGQAKCPLCRGVADSKKAIDFDTFKKVHMREQWEQDHKDDGKEKDDDDDDEDDDDDGDDGDSETLSDRDDDDDEDGSETESLDGFVVDDGEAVEYQGADESDEDMVVKRRTNKGKGKARAVATDDVPVAAEGESEDEVVSARRKAKGKARAVDDVDESAELDDNSKVRRMKQRRLKRKGNGKGKGKGKKEKKALKKVTLADLQRASLKNKNARAAFLRRLRKDYVPSAKITRCLDLLEEIERDDPTQKTIVFSQFVTLLDLIEIPVYAKGYKYERYTGAMNANARADAVQKFMTDPAVKIMLVSLKAGNAGLNLTSANHVIILDPFWNPFIEEQAIDRAHRIGQMREVFVHRLLVEKTVEDRIIALQENKRAIIGTALDEQAQRNIGRLNVNQIRFLFGMGGSARG